MHRPTERLTIGQLAQFTGISAKAIRYYEAIGLLPQPPRGVNQYRCYGTADVNRLHLLRRIRLLGVPLSEAKVLLLGTSCAPCAEVQQGLLTLIEKRLQAIDQEMEELHVLRAAVKSYQQAIVGCPPSKTEPFSTCSNIRCIGLSPNGEEVDHEDRNVE